VEDWGLSSGRVYQMEILSGGGVCTMFVGPIHRMLAFALVWPWWQFPHRYSERRAPLQTIYLYTGRTNDDE
jgi:hypothetical protein